MDEQTCPRCRGTGWVVEEGRSGPLARRCACYDGRRTALLLEQARIPKRYQDCSFANFECHDPSQSDALKLSKKFVAGYPSKNVGLLLIGPCGVGKTHLAVAILRELILQKNAPCVFTDFRSLLRDIQSTFSTESDVRESDVLEPVFSCRVLVLDELGAQRSSAWVEDTIFYIINHRYNQERLTIFTSNYLDTAEVELENVSPFKKNGLVTKGEETLIDRIGPRLRSRIYEMCKVVELKGQDYRRTVKQAGYRF